MKKTAVRYGLYGILTIVLVFLVTWLVTNGERQNFKQSEIVGWTGIFLSVVFVFFGLKYYRDHQNGGVLGFGEGLKLGLLIILFPSIAFGLFNVIYVEVLDPQFLDSYYNYQVEEVRRTAPAAEVNERIREMQEQREQFSSPLVQFVVMFLSVFTIGLIVTILSAILLKRNPKPAVIA